MKNKAERSEKEKTKMTEIEEKDGNIDDHLNKKY